MLSLLTYIILGLIGLMMGTIYKQSFSDLEIFRFSLPKITRLFTFAVLTGLAVCGYLSFRSVYSFSDTGLAEDKAHLFEDNQAMLVYFLNLGFIILMVLSNLHSFVSKKISWVLYLLTFGIYAAFAIIDNFFLQDTFFHFKKMNQLWKGEFLFANIWGFVSLFFSAALTVFNAYMTYWGLKK